MDEKEEKSGEKDPRMNSRRARNAKVINDVIELYLKGLSGQNIQNHIKETQGFTVAQKKVSAIINKEIAVWIKQKKELVENLKAHELAKVNRLEFEYWTAWQKSCGNTVSKTTEKTAKPVDKQVGMEVAAKKPKFDISKISELKKNNAGDPRFLDGIQWCVEMRCKLLGLDAMQGLPEKQPNQGATILNIQQVIFTTKSQGA